MEGQTDRQMETTSDQKRSLYLLLGVVTLTPIDGHLNTKKYTSLLDSHLWQVVTKNFGNASWIFQDDNCPCYMSERAKDWKIQNNFPCLDWPS